MGPLICLWSGLLDGLEAFDTPPQVKMREKRCGVAHALSDSESAQTNLLKVLLEIEVLESISRA